MRLPAGRLFASAREAWEVPRDLLLGRYPAFVTGGGLPRGDVPVFVFHDAEPVSFARRLEHLSRNGYCTLGIDEYLGVLRGQKAAPERAVVLTFDDGRASVFTVAAPLLRRHGMRAVVFLVPGRVPADAPRPAQNEGASPQTDTSLMSWDEVGALAREGLFEFESHTLLHARVHAGPELAGFATPWSRDGFAAFDQPLVREGERDLAGAEVPLGTPLLRSVPRTSEALRFFEDEAPRAACTAAVADGGERFFARPGWEERLRAVLRSTLRGALPGGRLETRPEQEAAIRRELVDARRLIEERLGRPARHLCYPWHASGPTARRLAAEAGYLTAFCGKVAGVPLTRPGGDPLAIARIGEDYLELLPGNGRATLANVLRRKWARRFGRAPE
jgi:peptidoglycan/xylan/chitin deacetylase (PgdA/CDA1 family)